MTKQTFKAIADKHSSTIVKLIDSEHAILNCNHCGEDRKVRSGPIYRKSCVCQGKRTGPKRKTPEELAAEHGPRFNFKLVKVLDDNLFKVRCTLCNQLREVISLYKPHKCPCTHKHVFNRTLAIHKRELKESGLDAEYKPLRLVSKNVFQYLHVACGRKFESLWEYLDHSTVRHACTECRRDALDDHKVTLAEAEERVINRGGTLTILDRKLPERGGLVKVRFHKCGCEVKIPKGQVIEKRSRLPVCPNCDLYKSTWWREFECRGEVFRTRSGLEQQFVQEVLDPKVKDFDRVVHEPREGYVDYFDPVAEKTRRYMPDFKVNGIFIEVKCLGSLGVLNFRWGTREENIAVNRAKYEAATNKFEDFRIYVRLPNGKWVRTREFWTNKEQQRLLRLAKE
jgi:hypothetical protein